MWVNGNEQMSSQSAAFRRTVAERMEAYRERVAAKIKAEMHRRGEEPGDLAHAIRVRERTVERWTAGESEPQLRNLKALANYWGVELSDLRPDLEAEERQLQAQLDSIEAKLDVLVSELPDALDAGDPEAQRRAFERLRALGAAAPSHRRSRDGTQRAAGEAAD